MAYPGATGPYFSATGPNRGPPPPDTTLLGAGSIFLSSVPYFLATVIQIESIKTALIVGTVAAALVLLAGLLLFIGKLRHTPVFLIDVAMLIVLATQLGVYFPFKREIQQYYTFITNAALAGITMVSMLLAYPITLQNVRECVPRTAWRQHNVVVAGFVTSGVLSALFIGSTLLYIVPVAEAVWDHHDNALRIIFQIVVPILLYLIGLLFTRLYPLWIVRSLEDSEGLDEASLYTVTVNPIAHGVK